MKLFNRILAIFAISAFLTMPVASFAYSPDINYLISDDEMTDWTYLTKKGINQFLESKGSVLANYKTTDLNGKERTVADIIKRVSKKYKLNPMLFIVMAQKESSAVTRSTMTYAIENWLLGFGRCDSCSEEVAAPYRGIANQIRSAAKQFREGYLNDLETRGTSVSGWGVGISKTTIDGLTVTPQNNATAALYTYNPCVGAYAGGDSRFGCNSAFQKLWQDWNPARAKYPNGSLLQIEDVVYLIQDGKKRAFTSKGALLSSHSLDDIIQVPVIVGDLYKNGAPIHFPNYSLLRSPSGTVYLLVDGKKRGITSGEALRQLGYNPEEIIDASWKELNAYKDGTPITEADVNVTGMLVQNSDTGAVYYLNPKNRLRPIISSQVLENKFPYDRIHPKSTEQLAEFPKKSPLKLKDGTLVRTKNGSSVFVIANGKRRAFESAEAFDYYGYSWDNVVVIPKKVLKLHKKGKKMRIPSIDSK